MRYTAAMVFGLLLAAVAVLAPPCVAASQDCTEWVKPAGQTSQVLVYRTHSLETRNENVTRALVFVHGINRDADNYFRTALAAAFLAGTLNDTAISGVTQTYGNNRLQGNTAAGTAPTPISQQ
jgi:hypothetical protein